jgi:hypothetical protein
MPLNIACLQVEGLNDETRALLVGLCQAFHSRITTVSEEYLAVGAIKERLHLGRSVGPFSAAL